MLSALATTRVVPFHTNTACASFEPTAARTLPMLPEIVRAASAAFAVRLRGHPRSVRVNNWPELAERILDQWAYLHEVEIELSRPGELTDNSYIEALNSRLRAECLNASWFLSPADAHERIEE